MSTPLPKIKICGIRTQEALDACAGADFVGFVFYDKSPRCIAPEHAAMLHTPLIRVGLFVDPSDAEIAAALPALDMLQLHGNESPDRVAAIKARFGLPLIKSFTVPPLPPVQDYDAQWFLCDGSAGGQGKAFDWAILDTFAFPKPWMLAGGLTPDNVCRAIALAHPDAVDVSSGVESARGIKDPEKIEAFIEKVKACDKP